MSTEKNSAGSTHRQNNNDFHSIDNYPTNNSSTGNYPTNGNPADNYPTDCHSPKDSSRYSHPDTRPSKPGPGGEAEE